MKPETDLPWQDHSNVTHNLGRVVQAKMSRFANGSIGNKSVLTDPSAADAAYIVHAANAYPKLVALIKDRSDEYGHGSFIELLRELGEDK